ncbi:11812_t:CDS:2 [Dentiscutata erythropus]|uniref:11812_t:CDS:1 n=1 Tax=Dentiscutata erythropus TaxID=1348616 RepID=A0A9N9GPN3_9GLOM|nr:11812_t:CDS:2 [Dentiscutata erythropus]
MAQDELFIVTYQYPILRDTTTIPGNGKAVIRFLTGNPGVWAFHCHVEWHLEVGMLAQFIELPEEIKLLEKPTLAQSVFYSLNRFIIIISEWLILI